MSDSEMYAICRRVTEHRNNLIKKWVKNALEVASK